MAYQFLVKAHTHSIYLVGIGYSLFVDGSSVRVEQLLGMIKNLFYVACVKTALSGICEHLEFSA